MNNEQWTIFLGVWSNIVATAALIAQIASHKKKKPNRKSHKRRR